MNLRRLVLVGNAHIDIAYRWRVNETVLRVLPDTVRGVLRHDGRTPVAHLRAESALPLRETGGALPPTPRAGARPYRGGPMGLRRGFVRRARCGASRWRVRAQTAPGGSSGRRAARTPAGRPGVDSRFLYRPCAHAAAVACRLRDSLVRAQPRLSTTACAPSSGRVPTEARFLRTRSRSTTT